MRPMLDGHEAYLTPPLCDEGHLVVRVLVAVSGYELVVQIA